jgi:hypothetical protein
MTTLTLVPAYGRDYKTKAEVEADWQAGKDFRVCDSGSDFNGSYTSIRDLGTLKAAGLRWVNIRYRSLSLVHVIKL